jgi:DNA-binding transcriptional regulator YiaG
MKYDGKLREFFVSDLPIEQCEKCGEQWFTSTTDDVLQSGLRTYLCLLHPAEIRQRLSELSLNQIQFANRIGVAEETVSRWLNERSIQNRAMDNLMRLFLGLESVRAVLSEHGPTEGLGVARADHHGNTT